MRSSSEWTSKTSTAASSTIHSSAPVQVHQTVAAAAAAADDDNDEEQFELFKLVFIYGGLPLICSVLVVWFFCSQTTLTKRQRAVSDAAANDRGTWSSRDQTPASVESSMVLSESSCSGSENSTVISGLSQSVDRAASSIAPLRPAYSTQPPVGLSLDEGLLLKHSNDGKRKVYARPVTSRSVDVDLVAQLADTAPSVNGDKRSGRLDTAAAVNAAHRLYVETPPAAHSAFRHHYSQRKPKHLISLPHSSTSTQWLE